MLRIKENKSIVAHIIKEFFGKGNLKKYECFISKNVQVHCPENWKLLLPTSEYVTAECTKTVDEAYSKAFHFNEMDVCDLIAENDRVSVRWRGEGLHKGNFFSMAATHRNFSISGQSIYRFNGEGQVIEAWQAWDLYGILKNLGYPQPCNSFTKLSFREKQCLNLFMEGKTSKETAAQLYLSPRTIEYYFENIKDKLGCNSKREIFKLARKQKQ